MSKLNEKEVKQILEIEQAKHMLTGVIDSAINEMTRVRQHERDWWAGVVKKYDLNKKLLHRIWIDGEIMQERRISRGNRKIF